MTNDKVSISLIEDFFYKLLYGKLTENVFFTSFTMTIQSSWSEMVLVDLGNTITDLGGGGKGIVAIYNYAKPLSDGQKNVIKLNEMDSILTELIATSTSEHYFISKYQTYADYDTNRNLHCNVTLVNIQIV